MDQTVMPSYSHKLSELRIFGLLALIFAAWFAAYNLIQPLANWIAYTVLNLSQGSHLGDAVAFFLYDVPKILLLLSGMIFVISIIRTFFSPERTRALLGETPGNWKRAGVHARPCRCSLALSKVASRSG